MSEKMIAPGGIVRGVLPLASVRHSSASLSFADDWLAPVRVVRRRLQPHGPHQRQVMDGEKDGRLLVVQVGVFVHAARGKNDHVARAPLVAHAVNYAVAVALYAVLDRGVRMLVR